MIRNFNDLLCFLKKLAAAVVIIVVVVVVVVVYIAQVTLEIAKVKLGAHYCTSGLPPILFVGFNYMWVFLYYYQLLRNLVYLFKDFSSALY